MNRRNFLASIVAAPWVVRSGVLMPVRRVEAQPLFKGSLGAYDEVAIRLWSGSLFSQVVRPSFFDGAQWTDKELAVLRSRKAPALAFNRIRIGR